MPDLSFFCLESRLLVNLECQCCLGVFCGVTLVLLSFDLVLELVLLRLMNLDRSVNMGLYLESFGFEYM